MRAINACSASAEAYKLSPSLLALADELGLSHLKARAVNFIAMHHDAVVSFCMLILNACHETCNRQGIDAAKGQRQLQST